MPDSVVLGATGLVGRAVTGLLLRGPGHVAVLARRPAGLASAGLEEHVVDFTRPDDAGRFLKGDDLYCCLGTTIAKAGSREAFRAVDYGLPLELARRAAANGMKRLFLVTSNGADARSRVFYSRVKGELEAEVCRLPFKAIHILRPSLLLGDRAERRPAEALAQKVLPFLAPLLPARHRPIAGDAVARAMLALSRKDEAGVFIHESDVLASLGQAH